MKTKQLTRHLHNSLMVFGYSHLKSMGTKPGTADPGASTIFVYKPKEYEEGQEIDDNAVEICDPHIMQMVNEEIDFVEIHITEKY